MNKRAEEAALKFYPVLFSEREGLDDTMKDRRISFENGYDIAEKETIKKALGVLKNYCDTRKLYEGHKVKLLQFFKNAMEEE